MPLLYGFAFWETYFLRPRYLSDRTKVICVGYKIENIHEQTQKNLKRQKSSLYLAFFAKPLQYSQPQASSSVKKKKTAQHRLYGTARNGTAPLPRSETWSDLATCLPREYERYAPQERIAYSHPAPPLQQ